MERDPASLHDIRRFASEIMSMRARFSLEQVMQDDVLSSALLHKAIMLGEAANRVSAVGQQRWALPWSHMIGLRSVVVHDYDSVDLEILWQLGENELPNLIQSLDQILGIGAE